MGSMESTITEDNREQFIVKIIEESAEPFSDIKAHYHREVNVFVVERWTNWGEGIDEDTYVKQNWVFDFGRGVAHLIQDSHGIMEYDFYEDCYEAFNVLAVDMEVL